MFSTVKARKMKEYDFNEHSTGYFLTPIALGSTIEKLDSVNLSYILSTINLSYFQKLRSQHDLPLQWMYSSGM